MNEEIILGGMSILFTGIVVLVPVLGMTLRLAIKPFFDTWAEIQRGRVANDQIAVLERQVSLLEVEVQQVQQILGSVVDAQDFNRRLAEFRPTAEPAVTRSPAG